MRKLAGTICILVLVIAIGLAQTGPRQEQVEIELMTYPEIYSAIHDHGKTTVLVYNGGPEQGAPHAVLGGNSFWPRAIAPMVARKLGNALVAPVLPFSVNPAGGVDPKMPGSVALAPELFQKVNEAVVDSMAKNGFKNIVLMGDHGGGQEELAKLAETLDAKYRTQGIHVYFCGDVYEKSRREFAAWLTSKGLPLSNHGGVSDTSPMLYLQPPSGQWVCSMYKKTIGEPVLPPCQRPHPRTPPPKNRLNGEPRPSTPEIGKLVVDMKVTNAVAQIQKLIAAKTTGAR